MSSDSFRCRTRLEYLSILNELISAAFLTQYPDIKLDLAIDDSETDIVQAGFDGGIRLGEVIDRDMIAVRVSTEQRQVVVASPEYLARRGKPKRPRDLQSHACIGWRELSRPAAYRWKFSENGRDFEVSVNARVNTNEMSVMLRLARDGVGLTIGPEETFRPYIDRGARDRARQVLRPISRILSVLPKPRTDTC
jgi:DNA-binding transcriptional LysR family regulator